MRVDVVQCDVLDAVVWRLRTALSLTDRTAYVVARAQDVPLLPVGGDYFLTVAPGDGTFAPEEQAPGNITEDSEVTVSVYTRIKVDSTGHDDALLLDDARGLLAIKKLILGALCGQDLVDEDGNTFLRQWIFAKHCEAPDIVTAGRDGVACGIIRLVFGVNFDWSLV
jgi:hypothetical protein